MSINDPSAITSTCEPSEDGVYRTTHGENEGPVSTTVVLALCEIAEIDPMEFQLYAYVDPESLDTLFASLDDADCGDGRNEIRVLEYRISICSCGGIEIRSAKPDSTGCFAKR